ncbi:MAG TPA: DUF1890 family protein [Methanocorpusculum sp.]|nr:DUF1890 family protein [Methanocorpusculum sp.]HJK02020.1 DUF1890 family protein [Methanocorpusculum sp.]
MTDEVLLLLGCPQIPVQSPLVLYVANLVRDLNKIPVVAANPSAKQLVMVSDPKKYYVAEYRDLDQTIGNLANDKVKYHLIISFIHNDAGLTYTTTVASLAQNALIITIIFGENAYEIDEKIAFSTKKVVEPATHNPRHLLEKIDNVMEWAALKI